MANEVPRKNRIDLNIPAELAIRNAMTEVEKAGAAVQLTNAIIKLQEAFDLVADWEDNKDESPI